jgi:hypothetical protein
MKGGTADVSLVSFHSLLTCFRDPLLYLLLTLSSTRDDLDYFHPVVLGVVFCVSRRHLRQAQCYQPFLCALILVTTTDNLSVVFVFFVL